MHTIPEYARLLTHLHIINRSKGEGDAATLDAELEVLARDQELLRQYYDHNMIFLGNKCYKAEYAPSVVHSHSEILRLALT